MRNLFCGLVAAAAFGMIGPVVAATSPLVYTLDLTAPCNGGTCTGTHPTDVGLQLQANTFSYGAGSGNQAGNFVATLGVQSPVVCDEVQSNGSFGPTTQTRVEHDFTNASPGGMLEFNAGGASVVDIGALIYDGSSPAGVAASYGNYGAPQVVCYQINPVTGGSAVYAAGPGGIFYSGFENSHASGEPWVSVQTMNSPTTSAGPAAPSGPTPSNAAVYVVQIHNASAAVGWHLSLGYDFAFFDLSKNGNLSPTWCVVTSAQPGVPSACGTMHGLGTQYTLAAADVQSATNSAYIYVQQFASSAAVASWPTLASTAFPLTASIFPPFGTYPQRFDDKSAVATASNLPTQNIGNIVCNNDTTSTSCTLYDADGNAGAPVLFKNTITSGGTVTQDPLVYFVDPTSGSSAPGNLAKDALTASNVSCGDPNGILASPITASNFTTSASAQGGLALGFGFATSGSIYKAGTATCTATFTNTGYAPNLSSTFSFSITMLQTQATHFVVGAPGTATAGGSFNFTVTAEDANNNPVPSYSGTVHFSSGDTQASLPANSTLTNGSGTFSATLKTAGSQTIVATDANTPAITGTSGTITVSPAVATGLSVSALSPQTHGTAFQISVTAKDAYGNTATGYGGTVHFTSTDANAVLPADQAMTNGIISPLPNVTLNTIGPQTVTATDTTTPSITGTSNSITVQ